MRGRAVAWRGRSAATRGRSSVAAIVLAVLARACTGAFLPRLFAHRNASLVWSFGDGALLGTAASHPDAAKFRVQEVNGGFGDIRGPFAEPGGIFLGSTVAAASDPLNWSDFAFFTQSNMSFALELWFFPVLPSQNGFLWSVPATLQRDPYLGINSNNAYASGVSPAFLHSYGREPDLPEGATQGCATAAQFKSNSPSNTPFRWHQLLGVLRADLNVRPFQGMSWSQMFADFGPTNFPNFTAICPYLCGIGSEMYLPDLPFSVCNDTKIEKVVVNDRFLGLANQTWVEPSADSPVVGPDPALRIQAGDAGIYNLGFLGAVAFYRLDTGPYGGVPPANDQVVRFLLDRTTPDPTRLPPIVQGGWNCSATQGQGTYVGRLACRAVCDDPAAVLMDLGAESLVWPSTVWMGDWAGMGGSGAWNTTDLASTPLFACGPWSARSTRGRTQVRAMSAPGTSWRALEMEFVDDYLTLEVEIPLVQLPCQLLRSSSVVVVDDASIDAGTELIEWLGLAPEAAQRLRVFMTSEAATEIPNPRNPDCPYRNMTVRVAIGGLDRGSPAMRSTSFLAEEIAVSLGPDGQAGRVVGTWLPYADWSRTRLALSRPCLVGGDAASLEDCTAGVYASGIILLAAGAVVVVGWLGGIWFALGTLGSPPPRRASMHRARLRQQVNRAVNAALGSDIVHHQPPILDCDTDPPTDDPHGHVYAVGGDPGSARDTDVTDPDLRAFRHSVEPERGDFVVHERPDDSLSRVDPTNVSFPSAPHPSMVTPERHSSATPSIADMFVADVRGVQLHLPDEGGRRSVGPRGGRSTDEGSRSVTPIVHVLAPTSEVSHHRPQVPTGPSGTPSVRAARLVDPNRLRHVWSAESLEDDIPRQWSASSLGDERFDSSLEEGGGPPLPTLRSLVPRAQTLSTRFALAGTLGWPAVALARLLLVWLLLVNALRAGLVWEIVAWVGVAIAESSATLAWVLPRWWQWWVDSHTTENGRSPASSSSWLRSPPANASPSSPSSSSSSSAPISSVQFASATQALLGVDRPRQEEGLDEADDALAATRDGGPALCCRDAGVRARVAAVDVLDLGSPSMRTVHRVLLPPLRRPLMAWRACFVLIQALALVDWAFLRLALLFQLPSSRVAPATAEIRAAVALSHRRVLAATARFGVLRSTLSNLALLTVTTSAVVRVSGALSAIQAVSTASLWSAFGFQALWLVGLPWGFLVGLTVVCVVRDLGESCG